MKTLEKIDKFYVVLALILILSAVITVITAKTIFSAFLTASSVEESKGTAELKVNRDLIEEAIDTAYEREVIRLQVN